MNRTGKTLLCLVLAVLFLAGAVPYALAVGEDRPEYETAAGYSVSEPVPSKEGQDSSGEDTSAVQTDEDTGKEPAASETSDEKRGTENYPGSGTAEDPYLLRTAQDLAVLSETVNAGESFEGVVFRMEADLVLPDVWTPIGALAPGAEDGGNGKNIYPFSGVFDGGGHLLTVPAGQMPLFGYLRNATVKDLSVYGEKIVADGLVANYVVDYGPNGEYSGKTLSVATFENVTLKSGTQTLRSGFIGGMSHPEQGNQYSQTSSQNEVHFTGCTVEAGVVIGFDKSQSGIGSFAGEFNGTMSGCVSSADVCGTDRVGGLVGVKSTSMGICKISDSSFHGSVTASGSWAGGIVGAGYNHVSAPNTVCVCIENCTCDGTVSGTACVGGIFGGEGGLWQAWDNGIAVIRANAFTGKVSGSESVGGVIGYYRSLNRYTMIENNSYVSDCGAERGIGTVLYVDSSFYSDGRVRPVGWVDGVYCFDSSEDSLDRIKYDLNQSSGFYNIAKTDHNRTDDPLGTDADDLCYAVEPQTPDEPPEPETPDEPSEPETPDEPTEPEDPDGPSEPEDPEEPPEPEAPRVMTLTVGGDYKTKYTTGDSFSTDGMVFAVTWSDGSVTNPEASEITFSGFDGSKAATCTVVARYGTASTFFKVTVEPASMKIRVKVAVYGDRRHDSDEDGTKHGLAMGGLTTWVSASSWEADAKETAWDVLQRVFSANGISARTNTGSGTVYVAGLTYRGVSLSEFDNGVCSGWMYTVNGVHPQLGVSQYYVKDGDSIVFHYTDDYTKEQGSEGYDDGDDDDGTDKAVEEVKALISAIGTPVTENSRSAVERARKAYDALTYAQKTLVDNYGTLTGAEKRLKDLKEAADAEAAEKVRKAIAALPANVTEEDSGQVEAARALYDALTDEQKELVTNYALLTAAERRLAEMKATEEDKKAAGKVTRLIDAIGEAGPGNAEAVKAARQAYDELTDEQKKLVPNYDALLEAEKAMEALEAAEKYRSVYETTGDYLQSLGTPATGAVGGEWLLIGLVRSGREIEGTEDYLAGAEQYVSGTIDENGRLHRAKSTENSRMIIALTALGLDVTHFAGHDLLAGLTDMDYVKKQGINGPSWALLALDSGAYELPDDPSASDPVTREKLIAFLLEQQLEDGGWALSGSMSDSDMTGMVLQALAPYYGKVPAVTEAVDRALDTVSRMQNADGTFSAFGSDGSVMPTSESISQILVGLSALGIDAGRDERFVKNGNSVLDALCSFYVEGGGFRHVADGGLDGMATEQAYYALTAYYRMLEGQTALYDMTDILPERAPAQVEDTEEETAVAPAEAPDEDADGDGYDGIAVAADAASAPGERKGPAFLLWGIPAVAAVGGAAYLIDRKRRGAKK